PISTGLPGTSGTAISGPPVRTRRRESKAMNILIANLGSTSFKFRLYDMTKERLLARGGVDRIGATGARAVVKTAAAAEQQEIDAPDHAAALRHCVQLLSDPRMKCLSDPSELAAVGFKAVHAQGVSGVQRVDERVLAA